MNATNAMNAMNATVTDTDTDTVEHLAAYLDTNGIGRGSLSLTRIGTGHSNITYRVVREDGTTVVLRRPPPPPYPARAHDVVREARIQRALARTNAPVPRILAICENDAIIGAPFYIAEHLDGTVVTDATPPVLQAHRRAIGETTVQALIDLHAVDWRAAGFPVYGDPQGYLDRQLTRFASRLAAQPDAPPSAARVGEWLRAHMPATPSTGIVHGDYRLGNVMFESQPPARVLAILDWEMSTVGDPMVDVGWLTALWGQPGDPAGILKLSGATAERGYPSRTEIAELYADATGRDANGLRWYCVFALWRLGIIMEDNYRRAAHGEGDDTFAASYGADLPEMSAFAEEMGRGG